MQRYGYFSAKKFSRTLANKRKRQKIIHQKFHTKINNLYIWIKLFNTKTIEPWEIEII